MKTLKHVINILKHIMNTSKHIMATSKHKWNCIIFVLKKKCDRWMFLITIQHEILKVHVCSA